MTDRELIEQLKEENFQLRVRVKSLERVIQYSGGTPKQIQASIDKNKSRIEKNVRKKIKKEYKQKRVDDYEWAKRYDHPLWKKRRQQVLKRDNFTCTKCQATSNLHVHHLLYEPGFHVWEYEGCYLTTLCSTCHEKEHEGKDIKSFINKGKPIRRWVVS